MKKNILILFILLILVGCGTIDPSQNPNNDKTQNNTISADFREQISYFSKEQLTSIVNTTDVNEIYTALTQRSTWETLGLSTYADKLAIDSQTYTDQLKGILIGVVNNNKYLKVIIIVETERTIINFGSTSTRNEENTDIESDDLINTNSEIMKIEISIDYYSDHSDIDFSYKNKDGKTESEYQNDQINSKIKNGIANDYAKQLLTLNYQHDSQNVIIQKTMIILSAPENYKEIQIEIKYQDGNKIEFKNRK